MPRQLPPIDDDIYDFLVGQAVPLEDDVNSLLRRLLQLPANGNSQDVPVAARVRRELSARGERRKPSKRKTPRTRAPKGSILHEHEYQIPILRAIDEMGGRGPSSEVIDRVGKILEDRLSEVDRSPLTSGEPRWRNRAQFVRLALIEAGDMKRGSPRGVWELSDQGRLRLATTER